jgi:hypothetical protein
MGMFGKVRRCVGPLRATVLDLVTSGDQTGADWPHCDARGGGGPSATGSISLSDAKGAAAELIRDAGFDPLDAASQRIAQYIEPFITRFGSSDPVNAPQFRLVTPPRAFASRSSSGDPLSI